MSNIFYTDINELFFIVVPTGTCKDYQIFIYYFGTSKNCCQPEKIVIVLLSSYLTHAYAAKLGLGVTAS